MAASDEGALSDLASETGKSGKSNDGNHDDVSSGAELQCLGCDISSKDHCPIAVKKAKREGQRTKGKAHPAVMWGKKTTRRIMTRRGKVLKVKRACGAFCMLCMSIVRKEVKKGRYKKMARKDATDALKQKLIKGGSDKQKFKEKNKEAVHLRSGGRSRIHSYKTDVTQRSEVIDDIIEPKMEFWLLDQYEAESGDPAKKTVPKSA